MQASLRQDPVELMAALAEPTRLAALRLLWDGREHCVCELMAELGATQSRMSRHMAVLKAAGLVIDRRDAQWVRYRRNPRARSRGVAAGRGGARPAGRPAERIAA